MNILTFKNKKKKTWNSMYRILGPFHCVHIFLNLLLYYFINLDIFTDIFISSACSESLTSLVAMVQQWFFYSFSKQKNNLSMTMQLDFGKKKKKEKMHPYCYTKQLCFSFKFSLIFSVIRTGFVSLGTESFKLKPKPHSTNRTLCDIAICRLFKRKWESDSGSFKAS